MANSLVGGLRLRISAIVVHSRSPRTTQSEIVWVYAHSRRLNYGPDLDENFHFLMIFPYVLGKFPQNFPASSEDFYQPCENHKFIK